MNSRKRPLKLSAFEKAFNSLLVANSVNNVWIPCRIIGRSINQLSQNLLESIDVRRTTQVFEISIIGLTTKLVEVVRIMDKPNGF